MRPLTCRCRPTFPQGTQQSDGHPESGVPCGDGGTPSEAGSKICPLPASHPADTQTPAPLEVPVLLDAADDELLALLGRDGRTTLSALQTATGQPESAVKRRLDRLRSTGVLYFGVQYDHATMGRDVQAMLWLTVAPHAAAAVGRALADHPEVQFASATTGLANLVAFGLFRSPEHVCTYLNEKIGILDGIRSVETAFILRQVKQLMYAPGR
ncbi:Lrp/AsnC family transcriptional regulator [Streptomyces neyagawaensis]|uniref:Lrp/AsnC family transcriptional regulator n=1 Tax=Streptomyces neyagawaensis TaxID=42238 RepID=A0ABV3B035_9ACTN